MRKDSSKREVVFVAILMILVLGILFAKSFQPTQVLFANDGPLGAAVAAHARLPQAFTGMWVDLNWLGANAGSAAVTVTNLIRWWIGDLNYAKFYSPLCLLLLGLSGWLFFRQVRFGPLVCTLGALAAMLNMNIFSNVCWGLGTRALCVAAVFGALAGIESSRRGLAWAKLPLAGLSLGIAIMEGADNGAIFSLYVAAYGIWAALSQPSHPHPGPLPVKGEGEARLGGDASPYLWKRLAKGVVQVGVVAVFAAFMATQALIGLLGVVKNVEGTRTTQAQPEAQQVEWDKATTWSLPKAETLRVIIPGLFGYRMDTENGGAYWGTVGQSPAWEQTKAGWPRYSGAGEYAGVLVVLLGIWAVVESLRGRTGGHPHPGPLPVKGEGEEGRRPVKGVGEERLGRDRPSLGSSGSAGTASHLIAAFSETERRMIWFWAVAGFISVLFAWGRYAPFYKIVYALPYFSSIRNPIKFMHPAHLSLIILFGYGLQGLSRRYLEAATVKPGVFERHWTRGMIAAIGVSILGLLVFANARRSVVGFLMGTGFSDLDAGAVMGFSIREVLLYILFLALSGGLVWLIMNGRFAGPRTRWAGILLGTLLVVDLARANTPWIKYYDYTDKYHTHPIVEILKQRPYEHRVGILPFQVNNQFSTLQQVYNVEWLQHHFQYYNIQSIDVTQDPRPPADKTAYMQALMRTMTRYWELTNTRYLFGMTGGFVDMLNQQVDPAQKRFRVHTPFTIDRTPNKESVISETNGTGPFALLEFTGALPRAKLYSQWQVSTNDDETLKQLASAEFNPEQTVIVARSGDANLPAPSQGAAGTVEFASYAPKHIKFTAKAQAPSVLLLNDKYDPDWKVTVDGKPAPLLRANFIMRGVQVPAGDHIAEFRFAPKVTGLYITLVAIALGVLLSAIVLVPRRLAGTLDPPPRETPQRPLVAQKK